MRIENGSEMKSAKIHSYEVCLLAVGAALRLLLSIGSLFVKLLIFLPFLVNLFTHISVLSLRVSSPHYTVALKPIGQIPNGRKLNFFISSLTFAVIIQWKNILLKYFRSNCDETYIFFGAI